MAAEQRQGTVPLVLRNRRRFVITEVALLGSLYGGYSLARNLAKQNLDQAADFAHHLVDIERVFAIAIEPQVNQWVDARAWIAVPLCFWYATLHYLVTPGVLILVARKRPDLYGSARTSIVLATLVALVMYWTLPTTPPRLLGGGAYIDVMEHYANWGWWGAHASAPGRPPGPTSSRPSRRCTRGGRSGSRSSCLVSTHDVGRPCSAGSTPSGRASSSSGPATTT